MMLEEIKNIKESPKDLKKFGLMVGSVFILLTMLLFWKHKALYFYFGIIGLFLLLNGVLFPKILKPINKVWMIIAILLGWVSTRFILVILFFIILTPMGFFSRFFKESFLDLKIDDSRKSYWEQRHKDNPSPSHYEKQF
jgi:Saxitoxin biosynthesis operon protein SxtJ